MENKLVEQISKTSKWEDFKTYWHKQYDQKLLVDVGYEHNFYLMFDYWLNFPIEFQKNIFEKYIKLDKSILQLKNYECTDSWKLIFTELGQDCYRVSQDFNSFEELLLAYFKQE